MQYNKTVLEGTSPSQNTKIHERRHKNIYDYKNACFEPKMPQNTTVIHKHIAIFSFIYWQVQ